MRDGSTGISWGGLISLLSSCPSLQCHFSLDVSAVLTSVPGCHHCPGWVWRGVCTGNDSDAITAPDSLTWK